MRATLVTAFRGLALALAMLRLPAQAPATATPTPTAGSASQPATYFPPRGEWQHRLPDEVGMVSERLAAAIEFARAHPTDWPEDFHTQEQMFGRLLGPMPASRAGTNGLVIRHGYVVAEFGDVAAVDPTYSVAKSLLSTVAGVAVREHVIADLDAPVALSVHDGGYDGEHNGAITWRHHLQQESEWQGSLWGKSHDFVGSSEFGSGARRPRALQTPGSHYEYNDVRINRLALSLLRVFGKAVPEVFRAEVMDPIGASDTWRWIPYRDAWVDLDGTRAASVSGGTRWGGGVWISSWDLARVGYLWLRRGRWEQREILPAEYLDAALTPSPHGPDYGLLWWLDTKGENWPGLPKNSFGARGAGNNTVFVAPDEDLVIVWRWHSGRDHADAGFFAMVLQSLVD